MSCQTRVHTICVKQYDTIAIRCEYLDDTGAPLNLAGITIKSELVADNSESSPTPIVMVVTVTDAAQGIFELTLPDPTLNIGSYKADILFTKAGNRLSSETFALRVVSAITKP